MSGESLPSGVLKVAEECARLAEEFAEVYILARNVNAPICIAARSGLHAAIDRLAALASPPPQATGAQPHPEPSEEASSLLPAYLGYDEKGYTQDQWADAQSQLNARRAERDAAREHLARSEGLLAIAIKQNENADRRALKAAPVVDVEARAESLRDSLRLDWLERHAVGIENSGRWWSVFGDDTGAAETLRKAVDRAAGLASPEGSQHE